MPTTTHQWLLTWIARKMTADGVFVAGFEGRAPRAGVWNALPPPFEVRRVRPDVWGINPNSGLIALGEAKTIEDIDNDHTRRQLRAYTGLVRRRDLARCRLYFAVPRSAAMLLDRVLAEMQLIRDRHIVRLHVPDCLVEEGYHGIP